MNSFSKLGNSSIVFDVTEFHLDIIHFLEIFTLFGILMILRLLSGLLISIFWQQSFVWHLSLQETFLLSFLACDYKELSFRVSEVEDVCFVVLFNKLVLSWLHVEQIFYFLLLVNCVHSFPPVVGKVFNVDKPTNFRWETRIVGIDKWPVWVRE